MNKIKELKNKATEKTANNSTTKNKVVNNQAFCNGFFVDTNAKPAQTISTLNRHQKRKQAACTRKSSKKSLYVPFNYLDVLFYAFPDIEKAADKRNIHWEFAYNDLIDGIISKKYTCFADIKNLPDVVKLVLDNNPVSIELEVVKDFKGNTYPILTFTSSIYKTEFSGFAWFLDHKTGFLNALKMNEHCNSQFTTKKLKGWGTGDLTRFIYIRGV